MDSIRSGTLSRRWKHLPPLLSRLPIHVADFLPRRRTESGAREPWTVDQVMTAYTAALNKTLLPPQRRTAAIKHMDLSFYLTDPYLHSIGDAVGRVVESGNTGFLEFTISPDTRDPSDEQCLAFGQRFVSFFQACPVAFAWLTMLALHELTFPDSSHVLSNLPNACSRLQMLSLTCCGSPIDPVTGEAAAVLTIDAPRSPLLALQITACSFARIHLAMLPELRKLVCIDWVGANPPLQFGNVPRLHNISLRHTALFGQTPFALSQCLSNTTTLSILYLNFCDEMIWIEPEAAKHLSPIFSNLSDVYLHNVFFECDLNWTMFVLEAAPLLKNFSLQAPKSPHHC